MRIPDILRQIELNYKGIRLNSKIVVIESDDWGSIRSNSQLFSSKFYNTYPIIQKSNYLRLDCLESTHDLECLFEVLSEFKDHEGNNPIITANTVVGNPDFDAIGQSKSCSYSYERFTDTLLRRDGNDNVIGLYKEGLSRNCFVPQFHGREHVNVAMWVKLLETDEMFKKAFEYGVWGMSKDIRPDLPKSIQATYDTDFESALESLESGLKLFHEIFGFKSSSFIANNFVWDDRLNKSLKVFGVSYLQGMKYQMLPLDVYGKRRRVRHFFGEKNNVDQIYGVRNCSLEVAEGTATVESCIQEMAIAFLMKKPAIISMHRINLVGGMDKMNRIRGIDTLRTFFGLVLSKWPDVKFMSTPQLDRYIRENKY